MDIKEIPGSKGYFASTSGAIFDKNGKERNQYTNADGYKTASVLLDDGKWQTYGVHRLLAMAHIPCPGNYSEYAVNHKDSVVTNNRLENLEWVSAKHNNIHACLFRGSEGRPRLLAVTPTGEPCFVKDAEEAEKLIGTDRSSIWNAVRDGVTINGWKLSYFDKKGKIPDVLKKKPSDTPRINGTYAPRGVDVFDTESGQKMSFNSLNEAASYFRVSASHIYKTISSADCKRLFIRRYIIVEKGTPIPTFTQEEYEKQFNAGGKVVVAFNEKEKKLYIYESASRFINENNLSKKAVTVALRKDKLRCVDGWWFVYDSKTNQEKLKQIIDRPGS